MPVSRTGKVIRVRPRQVTVDLGEECVKAFLRGSLKQGPRVSTHLVAVGDEVRVTGSGSEIVIEEVLPRRNKISRVDPASSKRDIEHVLAANLDWLIVVVSLAEPRLNFRGLDRLLLLGDHNDVPTWILLNKNDIAEPYDPSPEEIYGKLGYPILRTSAMTGEGIEDLRAGIQSKISVVIGPSGVGKSAILNTLLPGRELPTQTVSAVTGKGRHTTTRVEWLALPGGGAILDSPGIRSIQPFGLDRETLADGFREFEDASAECRFRDCRHRDEPDCGIKKWVELGRIEPQRYDSYLRILVEVDKPDWWRRAMELGSI